MARRPQHPQPPRLGAPDLPRALTDVEGLDAGADCFQVRITALAEATDAAHSALTECSVSPASVDRLDLSGATLVDVAIDELRATTVTARDARLRRVRITGGRLGTLDLATAGVDEVELRGIRIDYLSLGAAKIEDLLIADCTITTLDMPQAIAKRVRFENTRADEVDTRGMRADSLDLRGLEAASYLDVSSLRGATLSPPQVEQLSSAFAVALGIDVQD
ncbi:pentapeptide repeat-containing protein [Microbacterium sulfonylureivorans]|uniref:pentapeptide repeat-containing protein n=1 Tax=Microbacterium sulfonylureivorans TaxID=2486854 RepID=UPI000FDB7054|nr:pentapeptide repeat-containing protein [Microbacterium sulfonylureivorans]